MNTAALKTRERLTITLPKDLKSKLEALIPERKRSAFAEKAFEKALEEQARIEAVEMIQSIPLVEGKPKTDSLTVLDNLRQNRSRLLSESFKF